MTLAARVTILIAATITFLLIALIIAGRAHANEVLIAVLRAENGELQIHQVTLIDNACVGLLASFREKQENHRPIWLTLPNPEFNGMVIEAYCVMPDGSKQSFNVYSSKRALVIEAVAFCQFLCRACRLVALPCTRDLLVQKRFKSNSTTYASGSRVNSSCGCATPRSA
jgi:hypothetical protein